MLVYALNMVDSISGGAWKHFDHISSTKSHVHAWRLSENRIYWWLRDKGLILIRGGCLIIRILNIILSLRHILIYVIFTVKMLWQNLTGRKPLLRGNFQLSGREGIKREHTEDQKKWFGKMLCKLIYVCAFPMLCELSGVLALLLMLSYGSKELKYH